MKKEVIDYLQDAQQKAEEFGIIPQNHGSKSATNRFKGLFSRDVSEVSSDIATARKHANEVIAALTRLLPYFPELSKNIDIFKKLVASNSESWQYVEAEKTTSLKILLLKNEKTNNYGEYNGQAVDACLNSLSKLRMDDNEQEVVATISLADKMIGFFEKNAAKDNPLLLSAVKNTIDEAKRLLAEGRETYEDLESEEPDDVYQLAIDNAKFVINTINNFYNPQNEVAANESVAVIDRPSSPPPGLGEISKATVKVPPGLGTGSPPVAPDMPSFLQANTGRVSPPPPPLSPAPPVPPSREVRTDAPPSGMPEVNHEEVLDRAASFDSSNSSSGMDRPPPPIPSQSGDSDEEIDRASTPSFSDTEEEDFDESEPEGIPEEAITAVTNDEENILLDSTKKLFDVLANNEGIESDELIAVFEAVDADSTTPRYWNNLYAAVAGYVFAEPTPEYIQNNAGQGIFESNVKKDPKIYEVMLELYRLLNSHSHHQSFGEENISVPGDDNLYRISLQDLVKAMYPILNSADMTHAAKKAESKATTDLRNTSAANRPSQRKVTFDPRIPTTVQQENAKSQSRIRDNKMIEDAWRRVREATSPFDRILLQEHAETLERELEKHYNPDSPFIHETRDSSLSIDSYLGIKDENPLEEDVRSMPDPEDQDEDDANSIPSLESDDEYQEEIIKETSNIDDETHIPMNSGEPEHIDLDSEDAETISMQFAAFYLHKLGLNLESFTPQEKMQLGDAVQEFVNACEMYFSGQTSKAEYVRLTFDDVMKNSIVKGLDEEFAAVQLRNFASECINQGRENQITESQIAAVIHNSVSPVPDDFWTRPDDVNSAASEPPLVPPSRAVTESMQVGGNRYDNIPELFFGMIESHLEQLNIDELHIDALRANVKLKNNIILFVHAFNDYFSKENYTLEGAQDLMKHFDDVLLDVNKMINEHGYQFYGDERDIDEVYQDNIRTTIKNSVAEELVTFASNINKLESSNDISVAAIKDAVSLQRKELAGSILSGYDIVESGGGGYCGDRSIIQSLREAIRSGAISIPEDHELHAILQQKRGSIVGNEEIVSDVDAKAFRSLYVSYLRRANEPYVESLMAAGILNVNLDTVGDQENVYWLTDIDMKYISKWLKVNLNVVQNVGDRDDTFSYKPEVDAESIGTINIFNQGYENQDGIHYQALLPKSRTDIADDYELVEPEVITSEAEVDEILANEFDQTSSDLENLSDDAELEALSEEPLDMNEIAPPAHGRLTAEQLAAIEGIDPRNRRVQEAPRSTSPEEPNATVSNKRRGIFSGLKNRVLNNKKASTKTATAKRPVRDPLQEELSSRLQRQQDEALFGFSPKRRNDDLTNVTPVADHVSAAGLRKRTNIGAKSSNRVQDDSTLAPTMPTTAASKRKPGFVADGSHLMNEELIQQNSSEERAPVITPPSTNRANSSRVVEPEDTALESELPEVAFDVHAIPRPVAPKSLVAIVRCILDDPNNNTELDYVDTKIANKIQLFSKGDEPVQIATITDRKYDDPPGKLGTVTAHGVSQNATYDTMSATLKLIAAMPDAERTAFIHPLTVRNITTREQVIGITRALYEYCVQVSGSMLAAEQAEALKDIYINSVGADTFKQALYEFLKDMPDDVYSDAYAQSGYKAFTAGLLTSTPEVSIVTGSRGLGTHPPRTQRDPEFKPLFGLLHNYTPPKSFMGSMLSGVKRRLTGGPTDDNPKSPRVI